MEQAADRIESIPLHEIRSSPHQARKLFDEKSLKTLAESMRHEGLIQPITVRPLGAPSTFRKDTTAAFGNPGYQLPPPPQAFELVSGERRLRAAKMLGWTSIPSRIIQVISEGEAAAKGLVENLLREDLNPIEEAEGFAQLNKVDPTYWTQEKIAQVCGKDRTYVCRSLSLLNLPESIQNHVRQRTLSRSHAIELARLPSIELQCKAANRMIQGMKREEARNWIDELLGKDSATDSMPKRSEKSDGFHLGEDDPVKDLWKHLGREAGKQGISGWKATYGGNWRWSFDLDASALWASTMGATSVLMQNQQEKRLVELRKRLAAWFERLAQELKP